jgi:hypothetical protein
MTGVALFLVEPTGTCRLSLRRFRLRDEGSDGHYHNASVIMDENASCTPRRDDGYRSPDDRAGRVPHDDPRWPAACETCGEPFREDDEWQVNELDWYEGGGQRFAWGIGSWDGPPGAVMRAEWRDVEGRPPAWHICLPNRSWWNTNDRASGDPGTQLGPYWDVTGEAPRFTVSPSIDDRSPSRPWHGWIRDGELVGA